MAVKTYYSKRNITINIPVMVGGAVRRVEFRRYGEQYCTFCTAEPALQKALEGISAYGREFALLHTGAETLPVLASVEAPPATEYPVLASVGMVDTKPNDPPAAAEVKEAKPSKKPVTDKGNENGHA